LVPLELAISIKNGITLLQEERWLKASVG